MGEETNAGRAKGRAPETTIPTTLQHGPSYSSIERQFVMNSNGKPMAREHVIPSDLAAARQLQSEIEEALQFVQFPEAEIFAIKMAVEEALVNAIKHGNQMDPDKNVRVSYTALTDRFDVRITDEGPGFDPNDVPDPTAPENLERPCGRGLLLMRYYMTEVNFDERGSTISMYKLRNGAK